ncbi:MAG: Tol-Pal system beta propeller repeat protein TolB [Gammaproteobacteria bacterium]
MKKVLINLLVIVGMTVSVATRADEPLRIVIEDGIENALPIAIVPFGWSQASSVAPLDLSAIISQDLSRSGRFDVMPEQDLPQRPTSYDSINFGDWRKLGMENILIGNMALTAGGDYDISFRLVDVYRQQQIAGFRIPARPNMLRRVAHQISDIIFEKLTGIPGAFDTRVAYVTVRKQANGKLYSLQIADADGANAQILLESSEPLLSPAWSPDGRRIAYVSFEGKNSAIYVQDVVSGRRDKLAGFPGINSAPAFSPDGQNLAMTLSKDGNTEIYIMNLASRQLRRMTRNPAIDTEPTWSPDGKKLAFTSDRGGAPQIYEIGINGGEPQRLTFQGSYNARADYSPDGRQIALVHGNSGSYRIGLLNIATGYIDILTTARLDESPSFAPNGGMIIYATQGSDGGRLAAVSTDGTIQQRLGDEAVEVREPAWGPFLK